MNIDINFIAILIICAISWIFLFRKILKTYDISLKQFFKDFFKYLFQNK